MKMRPDFPRLFSVCAALAWTAALSTADAADASPAGHVSIAAVDGRRHFQPGEDIVFHLRLTPSISDAVTSARVPGPIGLRLLDANGRVIGVPLAVDVPPGAAATWSIPAAITLRLPDGAYQLQAGADAHTPAALPFTLKSPEAQAAGIGLKPISDWPPERGAITERPSAARLDAWARWRVRLWAATGFNRVWLSDSVLDDETRWPTLLDEATGRALRVWHAFPSNRSFPSSEKSLSSMLAEHARIGRNWARYPSRAGWLFNPSDFKASPYPDVTPDGLPENFQRWLKQHRFRDILDAYTMARSIIAFREADDGEIAVLGRDQRSYHEPVPHPARTFGRTVVRLVPLSNDYGRLAPYCTVLAAWTSGIPLDVLTQVDRLAIQHPWTGGRAFAVGTGTLAVTDDEFFHTAWPMALAAGAGSVGAVVWDIALILDAGAWREAIATATRVATLTNRLDPVRHGALLRGDYRHEIGRWAAAALRVGRPFDAVRAEDIAAGTLLNADGTPRWPVLAMVGLKEPLAYPGAEAALMAYIDAGGEVVADADMKAYPNLPRWPSPRNEPDAFATALRASSAPLPAGLDFPLAAGTAARHYTGGVARYTLLFTDDKPLSSTSPNAITSISMPDGVWFDASRDAGAPLAFADGDAPGQLPPNGAMRFLVRLPRAPAAPSVECFPVYAPVEFTPDTDENGEIRIHPDTGAPVMKPAGPPEMVSFRLHIQTMDDTGPLPATLPLLMRLSTPEGLLLERRFVSTADGQCTIEWPRPYTEGPLEVIIADALTGRATRVELPPAPPMTPDGTLLPERWAGACPDVDIRQPDRLARALWMARERGGLRIVADRPASISTRDRARLRHLLALLDIPLLDEKTAPIQQPPPPRLPEGGGSTVEADGDWPDFPPAPGPVELIVSFAEAYGRDDERAAVFAAWPDAAATPNPGPGRAWIFPIAHADDQGHWAIGLVASDATGLARALDIFVHWLNRRALRDTLRALPSLAPSPADAAPGTGRDPGWGRQLLNDASLLQIEQPFSPALAAWLTPPSMVAPRASSAGDMTMSDDDFISLKDTAPHAAPSARATPMVGTPVPFIPAPPKPAPLPRINHFSWNAATRRLSLAGYSDRGHTYDLSGTRPRRLPYTPPQSDLALYELSTDGPDNTELRVQENGVAAYVTPDAEPRWVWTPPEGEPAWPVPEGIEDASGDATDWAAHIYHPANSSTAAVAWRDRTHKSSRLALIDTADATTRGVFTMRADDNALIGSLAVLASPGGANWLVVTSHEDQTTGLTTYHYHGLDNTARVVATWTDERYPVAVALDDAGWTAAVMENGDLVVRAPDGRAVVDRPFARPLRAAWPMPSADGRAGAWLCDVDGRVSFLHADGRETVAARLDAPGVFFPIYDRRRAEADAPVWLLIRDDGRVTALTVNARPCWTLPEDSLD